MSDKRYYVKLKSPNNHKPIYWCGDNSEWQPYHDEPIYGDGIDSYGMREVLGYKTPTSVPSFTKSELAEIMDGAFYNRPIYEAVEDAPVLHQSILIEPEWINPLIELVPVEGEA